MPDTSGSGKENNLDSTDAALREPQKPVVEPPLTRRSSTRAAKKLETDAAERTPQPITTRSSRKLEADVHERVTQTTTTRSSRKADKNVAETSVQPSTIENKESKVQAAQSSNSEAKSHATQLSNSEAKLQDTQLSNSEAKLQDTQLSNSEAKPQATESSNSGAKSHAVHPSDSETKSHAVQLINSEAKLQAVKSTSSESKSQAVETSSSENKAQSGSEDKSQALQSSISETKPQVEQVSPLETRTQAEQGSPLENKSQTVQESASNAEQVSPLENKSQTVQESASNAEPQVTKTRCENTNSLEAKSPEIESQSENPRLSESESQSEKPNDAEIKSQEMQSMPSTSENAGVSVDVVKTDAAVVSEEGEPAKTINSGPDVPPAEVGHGPNSVVQSGETGDTVSKQGQQDPPNQKSDVDETNKTQYAFEPEKGTPPGGKDIVSNQSLSNPYATSEANNNGLKWETSSFPTFDDNMVSSVEGEAVLIVTNQVTSKSEENIADQHPKGGDIKANSDGTQQKEDDLIGKKVKKRFGRKLFEGTVMHYDPELHWYKVVYEDGDSEELDGKEVRRLVNLNETEEEQPVERRRNRRSIGVIHSLRRSAVKTRKDGDQVPADDAREESLQTQEDVQMQETLPAQERKLRGIRKSLVIDTSNDGVAESVGSDAQISGSSDEASEDNDKPASGKRGRRIRRRGRGNRKKRRTDDKSESEKEFGGSQSKASTRLKDDSHVKNQEATLEHRISTRRTAGSLSTPIAASDCHKDVQDRDKTETNESISPLGGGVKLIGRKTKKDFGGEFYIGEIVNYDNRVKYYKVRYEDGDEEELEWSELEPTLLPEEESKHIPSIEAAPEGEHETPRNRLRERRTASRSKQGAIVLYEGEANNGDSPGSGRRWRKRMRTASVSGMMKGVGDETPPATPTATSDAQPPPRPLAAVRFASASDADAFEYYGWGEAVNFERSRCPELRATRLLPTSSPIVHLAASRHHLAALTSAGQVWVWRCKHGNIHSRCNEWEHVSALDNRNVILIDISGPDVDRASAGYQPEQEDQVPDPFYLAAVCSTGEDIILQGSQPHELVHTYREPQYSGLREAFIESNPGSMEDVGNVVQVSVGMVEAADEPPFIGYITDTDCVYIRSATRDFMEEVNLVTGYTGKPVKIQCGRVYHAIIMTDDGRAWTWGQGYYPSSNAMSSSKWSSCQPAMGTLVGRKVIDVGCYGEDFIALTNDGEVHQWTHGRPNPAVWVYNVPATPVHGQGPNISSGDKLKQVTIGAGVCAGITEGGKVHSWRTSLRGGFVGIIGTEREALTPLGREEAYKDTMVLALGSRSATKVMCVASSLLVVVKRKIRGRRGGRKKADPSLKGKSVQDEGTPG